MTPESIETGLSRIIIGSIGIIVTISMFIGFIPSIGIGLGGLEHKNIWSVLFSLGFVLSVIGLCGAWWRLSQAYINISKTRIKVIRWLLKCGIFSSLLLSVGTVGIFGIVGLYGVLIFSVFAFIGAVFLHATPKIF